MKDEFYNGWDHHAPQGLGILVRRSVYGITAALVVITALLAFNQQRFEDGVFEFGVQREFVGVIYETPLPLLRVMDDGGRGATNYVLVGAGKFGLPEFARNHDGRKVVFKGTIIRKGNAMMMIELNDASSFQVLGEPSPSQQRGSAESLGVAELTGELVDTKCYFGVMRPASGKVHRACAVRCLSGGVPPGLLVRDASGNGVVVLLAGTDGRALRYDVQWAARKVRARGNLELRDGIAILKTEVLVLAY